MAALHWPNPFKHDVLADLRPRAAAIAEEFQLLVSDWETFLARRYPAFLQKPVGADPGLPLRDAQKAFLENQTKLHVSKNVAPPLIDRSLSKAAHAAEALTLVHPFCQPGHLAADLEFTWEHQMDGPCEVFLDSLLFALEYLKDKCAPLTQIARRRMHPDGKSIAGGDTNFDIGFLMVLQILLRWPHWDPADRMCTGFYTTGVVSASNLYRRIFDPNRTTEEDLLGEAADHWNASLASNLREHPHDAQLLQDTLAEIDKGWLRPFSTKEQLDQAYGPGQWRALRRRLIWQEGHETFRIIDNARSSCHNFAACLKETIHTVPYGITVQNAKFVRSRFGRVLGCVFSLVLGAEDMADAYRTIPNHPLQQALNIVALRHPNFEGRGPSVVFLSSFGASLWTCTSCE